MVDIKLIQGDCLEKMKDIPDGRLDTTASTLRHNSSLQTGCASPFPAFEPGSVKKSHQT